MKIIESLKGINAYPIPEPTIATIAIKRGIGLDEEATEEKLSSKEYRLSNADILRWLAKSAPNISQAGISYSFTDEDKRNLLDEANDIYLEYDDPLCVKTKYGYKGSRL
jgi:hypothetical protein